MSCVFPDNIRNLLEGARSRDEEYSNECMVELLYIFEKSAGSGRGSEKILSSEQCFFIIKNMGALIAYPEIRESAIHTLGYGASKAAQDELMSWLPYIENCFDLVDLRQWLWAVKKMLFPVSEYDYPDNFIDKLLYIKKNIDKFEYNCEDKREIIINGIKCDIVKAIDKIVRCLSGSESM